MSATADQELAELRRANAELRRERDAALTALALRNSEYGERIEQQAATIDVLKVMSASPDDALPVFRLVVERARAFCEADGASLALLKDDMLHLQAYAGDSFPNYQADFPRQVSSLAPANPKGLKVTEREMQAVNIARHNFHGEWNYTISPNQQPP
jgi:Rhodopirellula transposase DDE domain